MWILGEGSIDTSTQGRTFLEVVLIALDILVPLCIYAWLLAVRLVLEVILVIFRAEQHLRVLAS